MPDLQTFISALDASGELHRITASVSPILEVTEIADRLALSACPSPSANAESFDPGRGRLGGPALLFENVEGCDFPLAINLYGSYHRMESALECAGSHGGLEAIAARIGSLAKPQPPRSFGEIIAKIREFAPLLRIPPKTVRTGRCQEVVKRTDRDEVDLRRLPILKCWPLDGDPAAVDCGMTAEEAGTAGGGGRYITLAGMHTIHADDRDEAKPASHNIGMYRSQLLGPTTLAMHWHMHHDGASHWRSWKRLGRPMPIAIVLGGEPCLPYAATAPLPPGISELLMAGFLNGRGIPMVKAKTVPLRVPANAEIVIEGFVRTDAGMIGYDPRTDGELGPGAVFEGPFGDHTGFYSLPDRYPIVEVTAITHRRDAVYPTTVVGLPPQEDYYLGKATERMFLPLLKTIVHDIDDYHLPRFGCFHNSAFVRIDKAYPLQGRRVMHSIWGAGQMAWTKSIVVVDGDVPVHDEEAVVETLMRRCDFRRDVEFVRGPLDILDHSTPSIAAGTKIGFDATERMRGEETSDVDLTPPRLPDEAQRQAAIAAGAGLPSPGLGRLAIVHAGADTAHAGIHAIESFWDRIGPESPAGEFVIAVDEDVRLDDLEGTFFRWLANADPARDRIQRGPRIGFDARRKTPGRDDRGGVPVRDFPPLVSMSREIVDRVDARWSDYGFKGDPAPSRFAPQDR
jgi:4-hydroxy-3-polyprenylbenzoate decarboxylase